ncbi:hypothetical protein R3P38DRAFT_3375228 [Favolaschia claudopus]|uniref:DUF4005 domain-containing protein n=1 Tax=Favolaschia claudopus TaxID=2862362 RepID=A0AAV9ZJ54_9AGAR
MIDVMAEGPRPHESEFLKMRGSVVLTVAVFPAPKWGHIAVGYTPSETNQRARMHRSQDLQRPYDQISVSLGVQSVSSKFLLIAWKAVLLCHSGWLEHILGNKFYAVSPKEMSSLFKPCENFSTAQTFCNGDLAAGRLTPPSNSPRHVNITTPRGLSLRARREAARIALSIQNFIRRAAPSGKGHSSKLKAAPFPPPSQAVQLVEEAPRSGAAYLSLYRNSSRERGFRNDSGERCQVSHLKYSRSRIPGLFGNSSFRRPASKARDEANLRLSASGVVQLSKSDIKIQKPIFRRPPSDARKLMSPQLSQQNCHHRTHQSKSDFRHPPSDDFTKSHVHVSRSCSIRSNSLNYNSYGFDFRFKLSSSTQSDLQKVANGLSW